MRRVAAAPRGDALHDDPRLRAAAALPASGDAALLARPDGHAAAAAPGADRRHITDAVAAMLQLR